jgi:hypothetical protein
MKRSIRRYQEYDTLEKTKVYIMQNYLEFMKTLS